jgi:hypothetical protein
MTDLRKYEEQFKRIERWYSEFQLIDSGKAPDKPSEYSQDIVYTFFVNCYHLKDWIKHDNTVKIPDKNEKIEKFINDTECLSHCADICNGIKHLELDIKKSRTGKQPEFKGRNHAVNIGPTGKFYGCRYHIITSKGNKDAFKLARECIEKWRDFIKNEIPK